MSVVLIVMTSFLPGTLFFFPNLYSPTPLSGAVVEVHRPTLSHSTWFSGSFQEEITRWFNQELPVRPLSIRLRNQFQFSLFHRSMTYVLVGRNDQYFAYNYFPAFRGFDLKEEAHWDKVSQDLNWLNDTLEKRGVILLVVLAPNKVRYMPENLPDNLKKIPGDLTNQDLLVGHLKQLGVPFLNLNEWFVSMKDTIRHTPFPNTGIHWNAYGALLGGDTLLALMDQMIPDPIVQLQLGPGGIKDSIIGSDRDVGDDLNLLFPPKTKPQYYPRVTYDLEGRNKPNVLVVGDSFFWTINAVGVNKEAFSDRSSFWFYNNTNFDQVHGEVPVDSLNAWNEVLDRDVIILISTESNLETFPFGFIERLKGKDQ